MSAKIETDIDCGIQINHYKQHKTMSARVSATLLGNACAGRFSIGNLLPKHVRDLSAFAMQFDSFGDPLKVVSRREVQIPDTPSPGHAIVKMKASAINPADINMLQGVYPLQMDGFPPGTGGCEGVAEVIAVGDGVDNLAIGDWVFPVYAGLWGTWATHSIQPITNLLRIPNDIPVTSATTLAVNPCTAYRMLKDFVSLSPGDCFVQNGANSAVGQAAIQIGKEMGLKSINVIRKRETGMEEVKEFLKGLGADLVIVEEDLRDPSLMASLKSSGKVPRLGLDCVGGKNATDLMRVLQPGSTMVTYGAMSKQPMKAPASALIFKDIRLRGFWMSAWYIAQSKNSYPNSTEDPRQQMMDFLCKMIRQNKLTPPKMRLVPFDDFHDALKMSMTPYTTEKQILIFK